MQFPTLCGLYGRRMQKQPAALIRLETVDLRRGWKGHREVNILLGKQSMHDAGEKHVDLDAGLLLEGGFAGPPVSPSPCPCPRSPP